jgi:hypothetical protein
MDLEIINLSGGSQIRNYVNGKQVSQCFGGARANSYGQSVVVVQGNSFFQQDMPPVITNFLCVMELFSGIVPSALAVLDALLMTA